MRVRGSVYVRREMVRKRRVNMCFLSFLSLQIFPCRFCPPKFWSQANLGLDFSFGSFIHVSIHSFTKLY